MSPKLANQVLIIRTYAHHRIQETPTIKQLSHFIKRSSALEAADALSGLFLRFGLDSVGCSDHCDGAPDVAATTDLWERRGGTDGSEDFDDEQEEDEGISTMGSFSVRPICGGGGVAVRFSIGDSDG
ncbi:unnamed protein product [Cochlearia groenlandica]